MKNEELTAQRRSEDLNRKELGIQQALDVKKILEQNEMLLERLNILEGKILDAVEGSKKVIAKSKK